MSKYDALDAYTQLEQTIAKDLKLALEKRGFTVVHNGSTENHASSGLADIVVFNRQVVLSFEVTKRKGAAQDSELNSIRDHLNQIKADNGRKKCYCVFISIETSSRMLDGIRDNNQQRASEGKSDLKILPISFESLELWTTRLRESEADLYPLSNFLNIFNRHTEFIDDLRISKLLFQNIFPADAILMGTIEREEIERDQRTLERLIGDLRLMEDYMRQNGVAVGPAAIDNLIYLVFLKLYEEKRERDGGTNRLRSVEAFYAYRHDSVDAQTRNSKRAIHRLFGDIKQEGEFLSSGMFTQGDNLEDSVADDFIIEKVIPMFREYKFIGTRIDALGAVYEVLALRATKDVKVGQFFTPENIVLFMITLAELNYKDMVLDPACGTGRFLIWAMNDMLAKVTNSTERDKAGESEKVRLHQLFGADIDQRIAKIAKMNMWIHGDGKSNIFGGREYNGLTLHKKSFNGHDSFDGAFDIVLTNPPLGELNYQVIPFVDSEDDTSPESELRALMAKFERMPILPRKNITKERLTMVRERLETYRNDLRNLEQQASAAEEIDIIQEWLRLSTQTLTKAERTRKQELKQKEEVHKYELLRSARQSKRKTIEQNEALETELNAKLLTGQIEWKITGNTMKGGAMFLTAIWHYLKGNSYPNNPPEWRGGKMLIILDEGILNTDNYSQVREFLRSHFYIKAIISLTRDTFVPVSKTSTKTSIFYAVKKTDFNAIQKEPIFFGHVERVGLDTKGKFCANDLGPLLEKYFDFKRKVLASYVGAEFRREQFLAQSFEGGSL